MENGIDPQIAFQLIVIVGAVVSVFVWGIKKMLNYFIAKTNEKDSYIAQLVRTNQENVAAFTNTINHQRTEDRKMQEKQALAIADLAKSIDINNQVNREILGFLSDRGLRKKQ